MARTEGESNHLLDTALEAIIGLKGFSPTPGNPFFLSALGGSLMVQVSAMPKLGAPLVEEVKTK